MSRTGLTVLVAVLATGMALAQEAPRARPALQGTAHQAPERLVKVAKTDAGKTVAAAQTDSAQADDDADGQDVEGLETVDGVQDMAAPAAEDTAAAAAAHATEFQGPPSPPAGLRRKVKPRDPTVGAVTNLPVPRYVSLKSSEGNARRGPGLSHRVDWVFTHAGMPLRITAEYEHWRRVEDADGLGGWVNFALLSGVRTVVVTQNMAEFHSRADAASSVLYKAEVNVVGKLLECLPDWCRVNIQGEKGWAPKTALWGVDAGEVIE